MITFKNSIFFTNLSRFAEFGFVGGCVRDYLIGESPKDIDLVILHKSLNDIINFLSLYGTTNLVGKSYGVIKFRTNEFPDIEFDISVPRKESCIGVGHKDFRIEMDDTISIYDDLKRRDFTVNSLFMKLDGTIVDPFNGQVDLQNKILRIVDVNSFKDDPLRMLRAVQFASRFALTIDPVALTEIKKSVSTIKHISAERILIELEKIFHKGDIKMGFELLTSTGLFKEIFHFDEDFSNVDFTSIKTRADFFFTLLRRFDGSLIKEDTLQVFRDCRTKSAAFKWILKGENDVAEALDALQFGFDNASFSEVDNRIFAFKMFKISKDSFESGIFPFHFAKAVDELKSGKFPKCMSEMSVDGFDMLSAGLKGSQIGDKLSLMVAAVMMEMENKKEVLLKLMF